MMMLIANASHVAGVGQAGSMNSLALGLFACGLIALVAAACIVCREPSLRIRDWELCRRS